jgi:hypothetical protein
VRYPFMGLVFSFVFACFAIPGSGKAEQKPSPLSVLDVGKSEVHFSWNDVVSGDAVITVWNNSDTDVSTAVIIGDFVESGTINRLGKIGTESLLGSSADGVFPKHSAVSYRLKLLDPRQSAASLGNYTGHITIQGDSNYASYSREIEITVRRADPAVTNQMMIAWRLVPASHWWIARTDIPIWKMPNFDVQATALLGYVISDISGSAPVFWRSAKMNSSANVPVAEVKAASLCHTGKYTGTIRFGGKDDTSGVSFTVITKDILVWPIAIIVLGIYIAFSGKRFLGVLRASWVLRRQEAGLGAAFEAAQRHFEGETRGTSYGAYSIKEDVEQGRDKIVKQLDVVDKPLWRTTLDDTEYNQALAEYRRVEAGIADWDKLGPELRSFAEKLSAGLQGIDNSLTIGLVGKTGVPQIFIEGQKLLGGRPLVAEQVTSLRKEISDNSLTLKLWLELNKRTADATSSLFGLESHVSGRAEQIAQLRTARQELITVWKHLWEAVTLDSLRDIASSGGSLDQAEINLLNCRDANRETEQFVNERALKNFAVRPQAEFYTRLSESGPSAASDTRTIELLDKAIRLGDVGTTALALVIALLTGLNAYYFGKPFGTIEDYCGLFLWAAGTKVGLDIVTSVLDKFVISSGLRPTAPRS